MIRKKLKQLSDFVISLTQTVLSLEVINKGTYAFNKSLICLASKSKYTLLL